MPSKSGKYHHRIVVKQKDESTLDSYNNPDGSDATFCTRWASIRPISGREFFEAQSANADVTHRILMHSDKVSRQITPKMWGEWSNRTFEFTAVFDRKERQMEVEILAKESV